jgi:CRP-like cAMP-binding protein
MHDQHNPKINHLLALLPQAEYEHLSQHLELVSMQQGGIISNCGEGCRYVYFPVSCIVSMLYTTKEGASAEIATVGNEGMVGIAQVLGGGTTNTLATVNHAGEAYRLKVAVLQQEQERSQALQNILLHYAQALLTQIAQIAVCNRHHSIAQQICNWLLLRLDRLPSNLVRTTHGLIAVMLGVRREGVTSALGQLQVDGLIRCRRGQITILDRDELEMRSCECYGVVKGEFSRLLRGSPTARHVIGETPELGRPLVINRFTRPVENTARLRVPVPA